MKHLESCVRRAIHVRTKREEYNDDYPMHCEDCEGWGGTITIKDPSMAVESEIGENAVDVDNCESCIAKGKCPRCYSDYNADPDSDDYEDKCSFCEFVLGETEGKPYPHTCCCEELDINS